MTYAQTIAYEGVEIRYLLKIDGVDRYISNFSDSWQDGWPAAYRARGYGAGVWDDSDTHGELALEPVLQSASVSGGELNYQNHSVGATTASFTLADSTYLRSLFSRRQNPLIVATNISASATTLHIPEASTTYADNDYIHIGRECIQVLSTSGDYVNGCTRGALGTVAESHPKGVDVSTKPLHWRGRRCKLVLFARSGPDAPWDSTDYLTAWFESSPSYREGQWQLAISNALEYFDRYIYSGFEDTTIEGIFVDSGQYAIRVSNDDFLLDPGDTDKQTLAVVLDFDGDRCCYQVASHASNVVKIGKSEGDLFGSGLNLADWAAGRFEGAEALAEVGSIYTPDGDAMLRPVYSSLRGIGGDPNPADIALRIMLSKNGDGTEDADYDILPGQDAIGERAEIRSGAGLTTDEVDVAAWEYAKTKSLSSAGFCIGADGPVSLIDLLTTEIAPMCGGYVYVTREGKISIKVYEPVTTTASAEFTITDDNSLGADNCIDDESNILVSVKAPEEYDWARGDYRTIHIAHYERNHHIYGRTSQSLELRSRLYSLSHHDAITVLDRIATRWGTGSIQYQVRLPWAAHLVDPGDTVVYTNERIPNYSGGRGVSEQFCEVTGKTIDLQNGTVTLKLVARPSGKYISPVGTLAVNTSGDTWTFYTTYGPTDLGDDAWAEFAVGWKVIFISPTGTERSGTNTPTEITALQASGASLPSNPNGQATFDSPPGTIAAGDYFILCDYSDLSGSETANGARSAKPTDYSYISTGGEWPTGARDRWS